MLARDAQILDLDWLSITNISRMILEHNQGRSKRTLYVLHRHGHFVRSVDSHTGLQAEFSEDVDDPQACAAEILVQSEEFERVVILEESALKAFGKKVNNFAPGTGYIEYLVDRYRMFHFGSQPGIVIHPPPAGQWNNFDYEFIKDAMHSLSSPAALVVGIFNGKRYWGSIVVRAEDQEINLITTFDHLVQHGLEWPPGPDDADKIIGLVEQHVAPISMGIITEPAVFRRLLFERLKRPVLNSARRGDKVLWERDIEKLLAF